MKIEHIAIWVEDLDVMKDFYIKYFKLNCSDKYTNPSKGFTSYFLSYENGARIEIMNKPNIQSSKDCSNKYGLTHLAFSTGNISNVDKLTETLRKDGYIVAGEPRVTGDGYYESVVLDPEGNQIEITK